MPTMSLEYAKREGKETDQWWFHLGDLPITWRAG
jgi:hypothetical protein